MKILHLTLKEKWFNLIKSGEKTFEYRDDNSYWQKRLLNKDQTPKHFDIIRFKNGYRKDAPAIDVEFKGIAFTGSRWCAPKHGEILTKSTIVIKLGCVIKKEG